MDYDQQPVHVEMLTLNDITTNQLDSKEARQKFERSAAEQHVTMVHPAAMRYTKTNPQSRTCLTACGQVSF